MVRTLAFWVIKLASEEMTLILPSGKGESKAL
jgi:hypothetical protein